MNVAVHGAKRYRLQAQATGSSAIGHSYLVMSFVIGILGITLPVILLAGDGLLMKGSVGARGSLSAYYHSGMRDWFVGTLVIVGFFLMAYRALDVGWRNRYSIIAGLAAVVVALAPTGIPGSEADVEKWETPLQSYVGISTLETIHFAAAATLMVSLAFIAYQFGREEAALPQQRNSYTAARSPQTWRNIQYACSALIVVSIAFIVSTKLAGVFDQHSLLIGESVAALAFGFSWLTKGFEREPALWDQIFKRVKEWFG